MNSTLPNTFIKVASILIISIAFVSCSSKQKNAQTTTATTPATQQETTKANAKKATKPTAATKSVVCKNGSDTRTIEVVAKNGGCEVAYTKFDQTTNPATSVNGTAHCESVVEKIKGNLETSGFKCE